MDGYDDLVITLERTPCFGRCPVYTLVILGNGTGTFKGEMFVEVSGIQVFSVTREQLTQLVNAFEIAHFFSLEDYYYIPITDVSSTATSITFQGLTKAVYHNGWCLDYEHIVIPNGFETDAAPQALCDLERKIDEIVNTEQWIGR